MDGGKAYIKSGVVRCVFATLDKDMPNLEKIIAGRTATYSAEVDKSELLEALNCTIYLQKEKTQTVATLDFKTDSVSIGCPGLTDYAEVMSAKTNGEELGKKKVDSVFLKELASCYPGHTVMIASTSEASCRYGCVQETTKNMSSVCCLLTHQNNNKTRDLIMSGPCFLDSSSCRNFNKNM